MDVFPRVLRGIASEKMHGGTFQRLLKMNDLDILGIVVAGFTILLFISPHFEHKISSTELKMFPMENTRLIQEIKKESRSCHEENMTFFKDLGYSVGRIVLNLANKEK